MEPFLVVVLYNYDAQCDTFPFSDVLLNYFLVELSCQANLQNAQFGSALREGEREIDRQTDRQRQRQRETETDRQTDRDGRTDREKQTYRQTNRDRQTDRQTDRRKEIETMTKIETES